MSSIAKESWNPIRGCRRASPGCMNCSAADKAYQLTHNPNPKTSAKYLGLAVSPGRPEWTGKAAFDAAVLEAPFGWRKAKRVEVCTMSDLFYEELTNEEIAAVFGVMAATPHIIYQVLTKRDARMAEWFRWIGEHTDPRQACSSHATAAFLDAGIKPSKLLSMRAAWPLLNVHLGVSVEDEERMLERVPLLITTPAAVRWVSAEPLLGPVDLTRFLAGAPPKLPALDWVVVGGESGPGARPCDIGWVQRIVDDCKAASVPVFVKQLGAVPCDGFSWEGHVCTPRPVPTNDKKGGDPEEWPDALRVREWPKAPTIDDVRPETKNASEPEDPRDTMRRIGKRCQALLGRDRAVAGWRQAGLPNVTTSASDVLKAMDRIELYQAKAEHIVKVEAYISVLKLRGIPTPDLGDRWATQPLGQLLATYELRRRMVVSSAKPDQLLSAVEIKHLASDSKLERTEHKTTDLCRIRYRPGTPHIDKDSVLPAWVSPLGGHYISPAATPTYDPDGFEVYTFQRYTD